MSTRSVSTRPLLTRLGCFLEQALQSPVPQSKYLWVISGMFVLCLALSNIMSTAKLVQGWPAFEILGVTVPGFVLSGGTVLFPIMYLFSNVLTEVYGYKTCRKIIWLGFFGIGFTTSLILLVYRLPGASFWQHDAAFETMFLNVWRINLASFTAYWSGEFLNSYVIAKLKLSESEGNSNRHMARRFVFSTILGQAVDTLLFNTISFAGIVPTGNLIEMIFLGWVFKVVWEIVALPLTLPIVRGLKRAEGIDYFDRHTNFSPFAVVEEDKPGL